MSSQLYNERAVGYMVVAHVVSDPVQIGLWIFDCSGFETGNVYRGLCLGKGLDNNNPPQKSVP